MRMRLRVISPPAASILLAMILCVRAAISSFPAQQAVGTSVLSNPKQDTNQMEGLRAGRPTMAPINDNNQRAESIYPREDTVMR